MSSKTFPSLELELTLLNQSTRFLIGVDEVGRGAIAGPVAVGVSLIDRDSMTLAQPWPAKLKDSKLISAAVREAIEPECRAWLAGHAVGLASASEIDELGIVAALALAAGRAIEQLLDAPGLRSQIASDGCVVLLDGSHNWLAGKASGLRVVSRVKADRDCVSVAAASVIAKVHRDDLMTKLAVAHEGYGFEGHKGYASAGHIEAIRTLGPSPVHRLTWLTRILAGEGAPADEA